MAPLHDLKPGPKERPPRGTGGEPQIFMEDLGALDLLRACRRLQDLWELDGEAIANLLGTSRSTWFRWLDALKGAKDIQWTADQRARALALLRIFEAVADLHHDHQEHSVSNLIHDAIIAHAHAVKRIAALQFHTAKRP